jgi:signal transduction histidine kinase
MAEISRHLASTPQDVTPIWAADGIGVGSVLLFGQWAGYGVFVGSFFANFWAFHDSRTFLTLVISSLPVLGIAMGTTWGTLLGSFLLKKFTQPFYPLERVINLFKFLILTAMVGPMVNATVGVTSLALGGKVPWTAYETVWLTWWISNVSGIFITTPVLLSWGKLIQKNRFLTLDQQYPTTNIRYVKFLYITETFFLVSLILIIGKAVFSKGYHLEYMLIPILLWAAFRLGQPGATLLNFIVAAIAVIATVNGKGGFVGENIDQSLIALQSFIGVITLTILLLSATIAEREQAESKLRIAFVELAKTNETLEVRVQERTEELKEKNIILEQTLTTLKRTQLQMLQSEKMSALGQVVSGVAHEINNPISFIHGNLKHISEYIQELLKALQLYQQYYPDPPETLQVELEKLDFKFFQEDLTKVLQSMETGTVRIKTIVLSLRNFSRLDESELKAVDIHQGIESTLVILQHRFMATGDRPEIYLLKEYAQLPLVECYAGLLNQVFFNVLINAIDALEASPPQHLSAHGNSILIQTSQINPERVAIAITDSGIGIPEDIRADLFNPFFTTKPIGKGTGLGLSMSYQIIVEKHGGKIWCDSIPGKMTKFVIELPVKAHPEKI